MNIPNSLDIYESERGLLAAPGRYELFQSYPFNQGVSWFGDVNFADAEKNVQHPLLVGWELNLEDDTGDITLVGSYDAALKHARRGVPNTFFWAHDARTPENWGTLSVGGMVNREYNMKTVWPNLFFPERKDSLTRHNWVRPWALDLLLYGITSDELHDDMGMLAVRATETGWTGSYPAGIGGEFFSGLEGLAKFYVRYPGFADVEEWLITTWA